MQEVSSQFDEIVDINYYRKLGIITKIKFFIGNNEKIL